MSDSIIMWAVLDHRGLINCMTIKRTRSKAINAWLAFWSKPSYLRWQTWYRKGYRVVRVTVSVQP